MMMTILNDDYTKVEQISKHASERALVADECDRTPTAYMQHPWLRTGWTILPIPNRNWDCHFRCEENNGACHLTSIVVAGALSPFR